MPALTRFSVGRTFVATLMLLSFTGCDQGPSPTEPPVLAESPPVLASSAAASVDRGEYSVPFPPGAPPLATPACLDLDEALRIGGTWTIRYQVVRTPNGRQHWTEHLDYSQVWLTSGDLSWRPGPGAEEIIVWIGDANGVRNVIHQFNARYNSQDRLPDLRVSHSVHLVVGPDGTTHHFDSVFFTAQCLGGE